MITRELLVQNIVSVENISELDNFFPCLCSGFSKDVKDCEWNKHSWNVEFYIISVNNPTVKVHFTIKCGNRVIANCIVTYNRYTGKNIRIHIVGDKFNGKWQKRMKADVFDFIRQMILIFGKVAYLEKTKKKITIIATEYQSGATLIKNSKASANSKNSPYAPTSDNNISQIYKTTNHGYEKPRHYIAESWIRAGRYKGNRYIESRVCHRNPKLITISKAYYGD